ncbi:MAG TPA: phospholipase domain-containing protein [Bryobacteraceae bacterium]|nr:phospholipase domain-containing protein [Bryobacteraceae bacterium]
MLRTTLTFSSTGAATVVFQVRSGNPADVVRTYTVEPGKQLSDSWSFASSYSLSVYGPNGFVRYFNGSIGSAGAVLDVVSSYEAQGRGFILWQIGNLASTLAQVSVLDAYTGKTETSRLLQSGATRNDKLQLAPLNGWYDLIVSVAGDPTFKYLLAGHVETGDDSVSDPALGASSPSRANPKTCLHCQSGLRQGADRRATLCALTPRFRVPIRVNPASVR